MSQQLQNDANKHTGQLKQTRAMFLDDR